ncbi:hypothetical protein ABTH56_19575, partial [Acinetobacter baumannii]
RDAPCTCLFRTSKIAFPSWSVTGEDDPTFQLAALLYAQRNADLMHGLLGGGRILRSAIPANFK